MASAAKSSALPRVRRSCQQAVRGRSLRVERVPRGSWSIKQGCAGLGADRKGAWLADCAAVLVVAGFSHISPRMLVTFQLAKTRSIAQRMRDQTSDWRQMRDCKMTPRRPGFAPSRPRFLLQNLYPRATKANFLALTHDSYIIQAVPRFQNQCLPSSDSHDKLHIPPSPCTDFKSLT